MTAPLKSSTSTPATNGSAPSNPSGPRSKTAAAERSGFLHSLGQVFGRSLFPFMALALIAGTVVWGPWGTLVLALVWWNVVTRIG